jgi:hypothetical protein
MTSRRIGFRLGWFTPGGIVVKTVSKVSQSERFVLMAIFDAALTLVAL